MLRASLLRRLRKLEQGMASEQVLLYRYGFLTELPEAEGARHIVVTSRQTIGPGQEECQFEERPGAGISVDDDGNLTVYIARRSPEGSL